MKPEAVRRGIAARLKQARINQGLKQSDVALALGVLRQAVSKWENGLSMPDAEAWYMIGKVYGVSLDYLVYGIRTVPVSEGSILEAIFSKPGVNFRPAESL